MALNSSKKSPGSGVTKFGLFANQITEESYDSNQIREINVKIKDCFVYLLENTKNSSVDVEISGSGSTSIGSFFQDGVLGIDVDSKESTMKCQTVIRVPGGTYLDKLSFVYEGGSLAIVQLLDHKGKSSWDTPLNIGELSIKVRDSSPHISLRNEHKVEKLAVSGDFCVCNFEKLKISEMDFEVVLGSLSVLQNKIYTENKITVKTPHGTHCIAGKNS